MPEPTCQNRLVPAKQAPDDINLEFVYDGHGWRAGYWDADKLKWVCVQDTESTLPAAACRLLVAWAAKLQEARP